MTTAAAPEAPAPAATREVVIVPPKAKKHDVREIPLDQLQPHPKNRKRFDWVALEELAASLKDAGQITLATVRPTVAGFQLLAGERRWRASKIAGRPTLSCVVRELTDLQALQVLASENNQRTDLHPMEEAELFEAFTKLESLSQERIAKLVGRDKHYIRDRLQLLKLTMEARKLFLEDRFTIKHGILLSRLRPEDQARALKEDNALFTDDHSLLAEVQNDRKPRSVGEFADWVEDRVRFDPKDAAALTFFPEAAEAVQQVEGAKESKRGAAWIYITHDPLATDPVRHSTKQRIYGRNAWKRADGQPDPHPGYGQTKQSKVCDHSVLGVVASGPLQGKAFQVCVAKEKCATHWGQWQKERAKSSSAGTDTTAPKGSSADTQEKQRLAREAEELETKRWEEAEPALMAALAEAVKKAPAGAGSVLGKRLVGRVYEHGRYAKLVGKGTTAEDLVRYAVFQDLLEDTEYMEAERLTEELKKFGVDAVAIVDKVAPAPAPEKKAAAKPAKKLAGDVRRERAKKKAKRATD
jgi:ParB/RepB/Spo0J family partition protein